MSVFNCAGAAHAGRQGPVITDMPLIFSCLCVATHFTSSRVIVAHNPCTKPHVPEFGATLAFPITLWWERFSSNSQWQPSKGLRQSLTLQLTWACDEAQPRNLSRPDVAVSPQLITIPVYAALASTPISTPTIADAHHKILWLSTSGKHTYQKKNRFLKNAAD